VTSSLACYFVLSRPAGSLQIECAVALLGLVLDSRLYVLEPLVMLLLPAVLGVAVVCCYRPSWVLLPMLFSSLATLASLCMCLLECTSGSQFSCRVVCWCASAVLLYLQ
jgi:hypothetical protein